MKKILMLSQTVFPPDIRLEKEIKSLYKNGYKISVICNQYDKTNSPPFPYCEIIRIHAVFNSVKLNKIINFPFFLNPRFLLTVFKSIIKIRPDVIHAHDLPMVPLAILYGKLFRISVIFDMHENYPEALKVFQKKGIVNFVFKNYRIAKILEKLCVKWSDKIIVVVEENKERLINLGVNTAKIFVVSNTVDLVTFKINAGYKISLSDELKSRKIVLYTGTVSPERGLITPILGMKYIKNNKSNLVLLIVGEGPHKNHLKQLVIKENLSDKVILMDWPGHKYIPSLIYHSLICIIPQPSNDFINTTIPHKLFEYMAMSKPVLTSDAKPFKRIIEESSAGLVFKSNDPENFAKVILEIASSEINFGKNGVKAVEEKYNWENDSKVLVNMYKSL
ncbi:MAG: glycosyltransferase family 4 protein [Bacteroidetes bacterium]|nr:glycosyltransferase family 4 protein [Bacteroidota bacterium]